MLAADPEVLGGHEGGLTVLTGAYAFGPVSGGHFNPAVILGLVAGRRGGDYLPQLWLFWLAPIVGGVIGAVVYRAVLGAPDEDIDAPVTGDPNQAVS